MEPIPDDVTRFINGFIDTVDKLEILRVLSDRPDVRWESAALAKATDADPTATVTHLTTLHAAGLIAAERGGPGTVYRFGPSGPVLPGLVARVLQLYRERPVSMIKAVYARPKDPLRSFADAFRLRQEGT